jgi:hypothetical protein
MKHSVQTLSRLLVHLCLEKHMTAKLKTLVTDPTYWKGVAAFEVLFRTISSCLAYLEGDEVTFSAVYACFVAIKYHIKKLDATVKESLSLNDDNIDKIITLTDYRLSTIYT